MASITLNGVTFAGSPHDDDAVLRAPHSVLPVRTRAGSEHDAESGRRYVIVATTDSNPTGVIREWKITWKDTPVATRDAVVAISELLATFTFTDSTGSRTVGCALNACEVADLPDKTTPSGRTYWDVTLTVRAT